MTGEKTLELTSTRRKEIKNRGVRPHFLQGPRSGRARIHQERTDISGQVHTTPND